MSILTSILKLLQYEVNTPKLYGWFHIMWLIIAIGAGIFLCATHKAGNDRRVRRVVWITAAVVILLEIYKMIVFTFDVVDGKIVADFQWYAFPWQFCSTPMYVGLLTAIFRRGKIHNALCSYLATFAVFAGFCVMLYPGDVFIEILGIDIQTMVCHGSMITVGMYLWYTGYVKFHWKTLVGAVSVFAAVVGVAMFLNEFTVLTGIIGDETFNMFFISRHFDSTLPLYSLVHNSVPFLIALPVYIIGFSLAAGLVMLIGWGLSSAVHAIEHAVVTMKEKRADRREERAFADLYAGFSRPARAEVASNAPVKDKEALKNKEISHEKEDKKKK